MSHMRPLFLLVLLAAAPVGAEPGPPSLAGVEVRALLREALEVHAVPPAELPQLPQATTPASPGRPGEAPGKGVQGKASARALEVMERLRLGKSPSRGRGAKQDVEAASAQDRVKKARRQGPPPKVGNPNSGGNGTRPDKP